MQKYWLVMLYCLLFSGVSPYGIFDALEAAILLEETPSWQSAGAFSASSLAAGDVSRNQHTDLVLGHRGHETEIYFNRTGRFDEMVSFGTGTITDTTAIALADMNGDGVPDLLHGNKGRFIQLFLHDGFQLDLVPVWTASVARLTTSIAVADMDQDGHLDLAVGNSFQRNQVYRNNGQGNLGEEPIWSSADAADTQAIAWADVDNDGFLDLLVANSHSLQLFRNAEGLLETEASWEVFLESQVNGMAPGDLDGDGFTDVAVAITGQNLVFCNRDGSLETTPCWISSDFAETNDVAWGDADADGDLDLAAANNGPNVIYENQGGMLLVDPVWFSADERNTQAVLWFDNGDGDPDLAAANDQAPSVIYLNLQDANTPPVAVAGPDQVIFLDETGLASTLLDGSTSFDADPGTVLVYQWTEDPKNPVPDTILDSAEPITTFRTNTPGVYQLLLQVSDGVVKSVPDVVTVRVEVSGNTAPVVFAGQDMTIDVGQTVVLSEARAGDFNDDELTFQWEEDSRNPQRGVLSDPAALQPSFTPVFPGVYQFRLTAFDGLVPSEPSQVTIIVNLPPFAHVPVAQTDDTVIRTEVGSEVVLSGVESFDPDPKDTLTFEWFEDSANLFVFDQLTDVSSATALFRPVFPGKYSFFLVVNDGFLRSAPAAVTVQVNAPGNSIPVAVLPGMLQVLPGEELVLDGSESFDPDDDPLTFRWTEDPANPELGTVAKVHAAKTVFQAMEEGTYTLHLTANDGIIDSETATISITVSSMIVPTQSSNGSDGGPCFLTAIARGSPLQHWLGPLRSFRDWLRHYPSGRSFIRWYYQSSPPLTQFVDQYPILREPLQMLLLVVIGISWIAIAGPVGDMIFILSLLATFLLCAYTPRNHLWGCASSGIATKRSNLKRTEQNGPVIEKENTI